MDKNIQYIEKRLGASLDELKEFPRYFLIETIKGCNARCVMCPLGESKRKNGVMDDCLFEKIVNEINEHKEAVRQIGLYLMGEPLLDKGIFKKIKMFRRLDVKDIILASNGSLLNEKNNEELLASGLNRIYISIDGFSKGSYESIRKGLSYDILVENVKSLLKQRDENKSSLRIRLQYILQKENAAEVKQWISFWQQYIKEQDELKVIKVTNWGEHVDIHDFDIERRGEPCVSPFGTMIILYDGTVPLCCADVDGQIALGSVKDSSIKGIWQGKKVQKVREDFLKDSVDISFCKKCNVWRDDKYCEL
ncbi:MAG: radical SAM protein [Candidatus Omnitrophica bacterium]|nr:radical SAM protein [Candidatus Omnitrophota bacterium]